MHTIACVIINIDIIKHLNIIIFLGIVELLPTITDLGVVLNHMDSITDQHIMVDISTVADLDTMAPIHAAHLGIIRQKHIDTDPIVLVIDNMRVVWGA